MHEYSITCSIIEILNDLIKKNNIKKVKKINFELGPLAHIEPRSVEFYYDFLTRNNIILKNANLSFIKNELKLECRSCGKTFQSKEFTSGCIYCSGSKIKIVESDDIKIISIET